MKSPAPVHGGKLSLEQDDVSPVVYDAHRVQILEVDHHGPVCICPDSLTCGNNVCGAQVAQYAYIGRRRPAFVSRSGTREKIVIQPDDTPRAANLACAL